jgi:hypothetical protein
LEPQRRNLPPKTGHLATLIPYSKFNENFFLGTKTGFAAGKQQQMFTSTIKAIAYIFGGDKFVDFVSMTI